MRDPVLEAEARKEKKIAKIMKRSISAAGVGLGLFVLRFVVAPFIGENEEALKAISSFAFCLLGFGAFMIVLFIFKRNWLPKAWITMMYVVLPAIALKLLAGVF